MYILVTGNSYGRQQTTDHMFYDKLYHSITIIYDGNLSYCTDLLSVKKYFLLTFSMMTELPMVQLGVFFSSCLTFNLRSSLMPKFALS